MRRPLLLLVSVLTFGMGAYAQTHNVVGKVLDEQGQGYPSVGVMVKGTVIGTVTDLNGDFTLEVPDGKQRLIFQAMGYNTVVVPDTGQAEFLVKLVRNARTLEGAVVTALGLKREKREIGYNTTTVNSEELTAGNSSSALSALQGKVAGANISSTTGGPGGSTRIVLRGEKSILNNNNALIVVDGVITNNYDRTRTTNTGAVDVLEGADFGNSANDLDPDEIESISVLNGASATALYGERGAKGAVMITTKKGKKRMDGDGKASKFDVTYKATYTLSDVLKYPEVQHEYGQGDMNYINNDRRENFSWGLPFDGLYRPWGQVIDGKQLVKKYEDQPNNIKSFYDRGRSLNNFVSLSGGNDNTTYFLSLNALNNTGVVPNTFYNRYSMRFNAQTQLSNAMYSSINVNYLNTYSRAENLGQNAGSVMDNLIQTPRDIPIWEMKDLDNKYYSMAFTDTAGVVRYGNYGAYAKNPYWVAKNYDNRNKSDRVLGDFNIGFKKGEFNVFNRVGLDVTGDRSEYKTPNLSSLAADETGTYYDGTRFTSNGGYAQSTATYFTLTNDLIANWMHDFDKDFGINATLGQSTNMRQQEGLSAVIDPSSNGLVIPNFYNFSNNKGPVNVSNSIEKRRIFGVYADVKFNFRRELFLQITGRNDWSSSLDLDRNSYFYPGTNLSWVFTERLNGTKFKKKVMNYGKVRFSASGSGASAPAYANNGAGFTQSAFNSGFGTVTPPFNGVATYSINNSFGPAGLKPERTREYELGTDLSFLNDRLSVSFTYYNSKAIDLITAVPLAPSTGFTAQYMNIGTMSNKGMEISMRGTPIQTKWGLKWDLFGTFTRNRNKVVSLTNGLENVVIGGYNGMSIVAAVGMPYGTFYASDIQYHEGRAVVDQNTGLPVPTANPVYRGSYQPKFIASWGSDLSWKGIKLHFVFFTKQGTQFYSRTKSTMDFVGTAQETVVNSRKPYVWDNSVINYNGTGNYMTNTKTFDPYVYYTTAISRTPAQFLVNGSYVRLQEASIGYSIPSKLYKRSPFGNLEAGLFGNNLLLWTAPSNQYDDPEMSVAGTGNGTGFNYGGRPSLRNYGIFLKATF